MKYTRMVIGQTLSDEQARTFTRIYRETLAPQFKQEPGLLSTQYLHEEGGNMVVMITTFETREHCLRYHSSRAYRQLIQATQHLLVGDFVVKLFADKTETEVFATIR